MKGLVNKIKKNLRGWQGYPLAVVLVALATWLKYLAQPNIIPADVPILYLLAIVPTAIIFGLGPAILACILSVLAFDYFFLSKPFNLDLWDIVNAPILVIFLGVGILFSLLSSYLRKKNLILSKEIEARKKIEAELVKHQTHLEDLVKQRTAALEKANLELKNDITKRQRAEELIAEGEEKYHLIFNNGNDGIVLYDAETGLVVEGNQEFERLTGRSLKELRKLKMWELRPPELKENTRQLFNEIIQGNEVIQIDSAFRQPDGHIVPVEYSSTLIKIRNKRYIQSIARDRTEHARLEEERIKTEKLESISTLAGGIAHDFNNLLTAIMGNISLAKSIIDPKGKEMEILEEAEKASSRAKDLTQQLLTFSRGGIPVKKLVSLPEVIKQSAAFVLHGSKVKPEFSIPEDLWIVEADEGQISEVIHNLVKNANEAMPEGGIININAQNVTVQDISYLPLSKGRYVEITIADSGTGIKKEHLDRMFEPFFTTKPKGSGLGLATSYSIVKNHGGFIKCNSTEDVGTIFNIYLPASKKHLLKKEEEIQPAFIGHGKVLIMDDEEMVRKMLENILYRTGYRVESTCDGVEVIERYSEAKKAGDPFDAVILDLTIPGGMGGEEAIKKLLEIDPEVKAIVSSGYTNDPIMADYQKYGFGGVATKPYNVAEIEKTLNNLLDNNKK